MALRKLFTKAGDAVRLTALGAVRPRYMRAFDRFKQYTMVPARLYLRNLELVQRFAHVPGLVVECGVWKGGMVAGIASILGPDREYYLFDSFEGLPPPKPIDGEAALRWQSDIDGPWYFDNCSADIRFAEEAMRRAGVSRAHLVKGFFADTLPGFNPAERIAILRLDGDWYDSTMVCLEHLYPRVAPGGLIVIDDYYAWDGCARAVHDYLSRSGSADRVRQFRDDLCYIVKGSVSASD